MIIDAHQHFWNYNAENHNWISDDMKVIRRDFLPSELADIYKANGIDGCVSVQVDQDELENEFLQNLANSNSFIKGIVGWVDLRSRAIQQRLELYSQFKLIKGFRHIVQGEADNEFLLREEFCNGIKFLSRYGFTYDILVFAHQLLQVEPFVKKFNDQLFVIDHIAKPDIRNHSIKEWKEHMKKIAAYPKVHCKLSGMVTEADPKSWKYEDLEPYMNEVLEAFGPGRLLYGSDWPVCLVAASYPQQFAVVQRFIKTLSAGEQAKILGENAVRFYHL